MAYGMMLLVPLATLFIHLSYAASVPLAGTLNQHNVANLTLLPNGTLAPLLPKVNNLAGTITCKASSRFVPWTYRPSVRDCGQAVRLLPSGGDIATFRRRNVGQPLYEIPRSVTVGSCIVTVELLERAQSCISSWTEIGLAATEEILGCLKGDKTGGHTTCGEQDKIIVRLDYVPNSDPDGFVLGDEPEMTDLEIYNALTGKDCGTNCRG